MVSCSESGIIKLYQALYQAFVYREPGPASYKENIPKTFRKHSEGHHLKPLLSAGALGRPIPDQILDYGLVNARSKLQALSGTLSPSGSRPGHSQPQPADVAPLGSLVANGGATDYGYTLKRSGPGYPHRGKGERGRGAGRCGRGEEGREVHSQKIQPGNTHREHAQEGLGGGVPERPQGEGRPLGKMARRTTGRVPKGVR